MRSFSRLILIFAMSFAPTVRAGDKIKTLNTPAGDGILLSGPKEDSINQGADQAKQSQDQGSMANMMAGMALMGMFIAGCKPPTTTWGCAAGPMAALAFMQAGHDSGASDDSAATYNASKYKPQKYDTADNTTDPNDPTTTPTGTKPKGLGGYTGNPEADKNLALLEDKGITVDPDSGEVTTPTGTYPASAFSSPGAMAAAGMSAADVQSAEKVLANLNNGEYAASVSGMELDSSGGGGGGYGGGSGGSTYESPLADYLASLKKRMNKNKDRMIAGKTVSYGDGRIGVKMDNIFTMINRRYEEKKKYRNFIGESSGKNQNRGTLNGGY